MADKALDAALAVLWQKIGEEDREALKVMAAYLTLKPSSYVIDETCATKNLGILLETLIKLTSIGFLNRERDMVSFASNEIRAFVKNKMDDKDIVTG